MLRELLEMSHVPLESLTGCRNGIKEEKLREFTGEGIKRALQKTLREHSGLRWVGGWK